jgi:hypothetical protein
MMSDPLKAARDVIEELRYCEAILADCDQDDSIGTLTAERLHSLLWSASAALEHFAELYRALAELDES